MRLVFVHNFIISNRGGHARFTDALLPTSGERIQSWLPNWDLEAGVAARTDRRLALIGHGCIVPKPDP
jgi:hypothetical protein